jgi:hypothetical protein
MEDARHLSRNAVIAADEYIVREDPESTKVLTSLLRKVMQEDGSTWEAICYLDELKIPNPGMDYRIKYDSEGRPEAVCYILPEMRQDLLRFGDILFLDSQKRQFNSMNWPYIGPCVKDQDMKVRTVCEMICVEESTRMYAWVVQMLHDMEPRFLLSHIRLIFGDQGITQALLETLGVVPTCLLRGDYHHLIDEVFPDQFGVHKFTIIAGHLSIMLLGPKKQWEISYIAAKELLQGDAEKVSLLNSIHDNPKYYAAWYLRTIPGNLMLNGAVPAEQNHSSVVAHLGKGANWGVAEHLSHMLQRQIHLTKLRREKDNSRFVSTHRYKSKIDIDDETAKKSLSKYGYDLLYKIEYRRSRRLQHLNLDDGSINVWPCGQLMDCDRLVVIQPGDRCTCQRRIAFDHQCCHELCLEGGFDTERFGRRWLNEKAFQQHHPNVWLEDHLPACSKKAKELGEELGDQSSVEANPYSNDLDSDDNAEEEFSEKENHQPQDSDTDSDSSDEDTPLSKLKQPTYQSLIQQFEVLARLVQSDCNSLASVSKMIQTVTGRARNGMSIAAHFDTTFGSNVSKKDAQRTPINGAMHASSTATLHNRLRSRHEKRRDHSTANRKRSLPSNNIPIGLLPSNDRAHLAPPKTNKKGCSLCTISGHSRPNCPRTNCYKRAPLKHGDMECRVKLSSNLAVPNIFPTSIPQLGDKRLVSPNLPKLIKGIVIHERRFIRGDLQNNNTTTNMCLECTILGPLGLPLADCTKQLFMLPTIQRYITKAKTNVLICEFDYDESQSLLNSVAAPPLSQMSQYSNDAMTMGGYPYSDPFNLNLGYGMPSHNLTVPMGYGIPHTGNEIGYGTGELGPNM